MKKENTKLSPMIVDCKSKGIEVLEYMDRSLVEVPSKNFAPQPRYKEWELQYF